MIARFGYVKTMRGGWTPELRFYERGEMIRPEPPMAKEVEIPNYTVPYPPEHCSFHLLTKCYPPPAQESEAA